MTRHDALSPGSAGGVVSVAATGSTDNPAPPLPFEIPARRLGQGRLRAERVGEFRAYCRATIVRPAVRECAFATLDGDELIDHMATMHAVRPLKPAARIKPSTWVGPARVDWTPKPWDVGTVVEFRGNRGRTRRGTVWSYGPPGAATRWVIPHEPEADEAALLVRAERTTRHGYVLRTWTHAQGRAFARRHRALVEADAFVQTYTGNPDAPAPVRYRPVITHLPDCPRLDNLTPEELAGEHNNIAWLLQQLVRVDDPIRWCDVCLGEPESTPGA